MRVSDLQDWLNEAEKFVGPAVLADRNALPGIYDQTVKLRDGLFKILDEKEAEALERIILKNSGIMQDELVRTHEFKDIREETLDLLVDLMPWLDLQQTAQKNGNERQRQAANSVFEHMKFFVHATHAVREMIVSQLKQRQEEASI